jgi:hypothetical protein
MKVNNSEKFTGNARFEGFSIDLIEEISKIRKFKYEFELEPENRYGNFDRKTQKWDGLVKQILERVNIKFQFVYFFRHRIYIFCFIARRFCNL